MAQRHSIHKDKHIHYSFWLVFGDDGSLRMTRGEPDVSRGERAMECRTILPISLFDTPVLKASIRVDEPGVTAMPFDIHAAGDALKYALGVDIDMQITSETK